MRRGMHDKGFLYGDAGTLWAVALGYDFTAEHEWGVERLKRDFGVGQAASKGLESRRMTIKPESLSFYQSRDGKEALLSCVTFISPTTLDTEVRKASELRNHEALKFYDYDHRKSEPEDDFVAAWDGGEFAIHVRGTENVTALKTLHEAFKRCEIVFGMAPAEAWIGNGLLFAINSSFDDEAKAKILERDESEERLQKVVEASGIKDTLKKANCSYFALRPEWKDDEESEVKFWLNPCQQQSNNFGWYSFADLEAWANGDGRVPKSAS